MQDFPHDRGIFKTPHPCQKVLTPGSSAGCAGLRHTPGDSTPVGEMALRPRPPGLPVGRGGKPRHSARWGNLGVLARAPLPASSIGGKTAGRLRWGTRLPRPANLRSCPRPCPSNLRPAWCSPGRRIPPCAAPDSVAPRRPGGERQPDGRMRYWGYVPELGKWLRVIVEPDGAIHNAFPDRNFKGARP
jgi:hypothetical protein